jgi:hypothetical protein
MCMQVQCNKIITRSAVLGIVRQVPVVALEMTTVQPHMMPKAPERTQLNSNQVSIPI